MSILEKIFFILYILFTMSVGYFFRDIIKTFDHEKEILKESLKLKDLYIKFLLDKTKTLKVENELLTKELL